MLENNIRYIIYLLEMIQILISYTELRTITFSILKKTCSIMLGARLSIYGTISGMDKGQFKKIVNE